MSEFAQFFSVVALALLLLVLLVSWPVIFPADRREDQEGEE